jgi:hypothetical protein
VIATAMTPSEKDSSRLVPIMQTFAGGASDPGLGRDVNPIASVEYRHHSMRRTE